MGREIRMVPKGWEHPLSTRGNLQPLYDQDYESAARDWINNFIAWENGSHPDTKYKDSETLYYWDWDGDPPDKAFYRPKWDTEPTCYQIYETVSEGTPISPVFETKEEIVGWLIKQGHSEEAAICFVRDKWAPSFVFTPGVGLLSGIDAAALSAPCKED